MSQEIERKFLVTGDYKSRAYEQSRIVQGYISSARGRTVRVRIRSGKGYLTIKGASDASGLSRYEWEKEIPLNEAEELMKLCGVGEKVAECICLFALHHMDAFPIDTHIRQVMDVHYKRGFPNRRYRGMRGIMQQYIFYYDLYS